MSSEKNLNCLVSILLATCISAAAVGCMVTGLGLKVEDLHNIVMVCFLCAAVASFCYRFRYGGWALRLITLAGVYWFLQDPERLGILLEQARVLANRMTKLWNHAYGWHVISLRAQRVCDQPLMIVGGFLAIAVSRTVCGRKRAIFPVLVSMGPLGSCLVVTDTVPELPWLFALLLGLAVLILTDDLRRKNLRQSLELTAAAFIGTAAALVLLFFLSPQEAYVNKTEKLQGHLLNIAQELPVSMKEWGQTLITKDIQTVQPQRENLSSLGNRIERAYTVLEVTTSYDGFLYLRGQDFDGYDGKAWTATRNRMENFTAGTDGLWEEEGRTVTVTTRAAKDVRYVPYYPLANTTLIGGKAANAESLLTYSYIQRTLPEDWKESLQAVSFIPQINATDDLALTAGLYEPATDTWRYRTLPLETKERAKEILSQFLPDGGHTTTAMAESIAEYVRNSASYSLTPDKMPADAKDFAIWFLEEADRGYCIHFASAATVLLRAAGIDARYVTGYVARTVPGQTVAVPASQSHAWVEYFEPILGTWVVLEPTPPDFAMEPPELADDPIPGEDIQTDITLPTLPEPTLPERQPEDPDTPGTEPSAGSEKAPELPGVLTGLLTVLKWLFALAMTVAAVLGQYLLRLHLRAKRCAAEDPNQRALALWQECTRLFRLTKQELPEDLEALAQKAKFSQHAMTEQELSQFRAAIREARQSLQSRPWYRQLLYRLVFAAY